MTTKGNAGIPRKQREYHGGKRTPEYKAWQEMRRRCYSEKRWGYQYYGARGIKICSGWLASFKSFLTDMGLRPSPNHSIDRMNNNGNYSCGHCDECVASGWTANCRWATKKEQNNNSRHNHRFVYKGKSHTISQLREICGFSYEVVIRRLERGWTVERAVETPLFSRSGFKDRLPPRSPKGREAVCENRTQAFLFPLGL